MILNSFLFVLIALTKSCKAIQLMELLGRKEGIVGYENFTYYYIHHMGNIFFLSLKSNVGDADLYVSDTNMIPTYDPDTYDLQSATCGLDILEIPNGFKSPISVGIYGHSAYDESHYTLEIYKAPTENEELASSFLIIENGNTEGIPEIKVAPKDEKGKVTIKSKNKKKLHNISTKLGGVFSLFEIIELIFL